MLNVSRCGNALLWCRGCISYVCTIVRSHASDRHLHINIVDTKIHTVFCRGWSSHSAKLHGDNFLLVKKELYE
jgi:hypothetical protein